MRFALVLSVSLVACAGDDTDPIETDLVDTDVFTDTDSDPDTDTDTDPDTDTDTDTDTAPDTGMDPDPCTVVIPGGTTVVTEDAVVVSDPDQTLWVCKNSNASVSGANALMFADDGADAVLNASGARVYVQSTARLALFQPGNEIVTEDEGSIEDKVGGNTIIVCPTITFELSEAPEPGC